MSLSRFTMRAARLGASSSRLTTNATKAPAFRRYASSAAGQTHQASSSTQSRALFTRVAVAGGIALGAGIAMNGSSALQLEAAASKRKSYSERMVGKEQGSGNGGQGSTGEKKGSGEADSPLKRGGEEVEIANAGPVDMDDLSGEADQQSAFDPETNTINWDCPCLGGMATGPCGEQFKEAFSCFVFSETEVKGENCIEHFKTMQDCFRKYPEHYKEELEGDDDDEESFEAAGGSTSSKNGAGSQKGEDDDDAGVREWRSEMAKEK